MASKLCLLAFGALGLRIAAAQLPPPPPPPPPPAFMTMKGLPLSCFAKPSFEEDGLDFFVCNGGGGLAGVRKKNDPKHLILVRDPDIASNLGMQAAKVDCGAGKFSVAADAEGIISFRCNGSEVSHDARFQAAPKSQWLAWQKYLNK